MKYLWIFIGLPFLAWGQPSSSSSVPKLLECTHEMLGTNDVLVSGTPYILSHKNAKGFPFFKSTDLYTGTVYVKGSEFPAQTLQYDLEVDKLVLHKTLKSGIPYHISLYDNLVDSFTLDKSLFISKRNLPNLSDTDGYMERIFEGNFSFYMTQRKYFSQQFTERNPYGKFSESQTKYFVYYKNEWNTISSFKDFLKLFPESSKEIKRFAKKEKIRFKKANNIQLTRLLQFSHEQL